MTRDYSNLKSSEFLRLYHLSRNSNLCVDILKLTPNENIWCQTMLGTSLQRGLTEAILTIVDGLKTEFDLT